MDYKKPEVIAQNQPTGSYAAGCPAIGVQDGDCKHCERTHWLIMG